MSVTTYQTTIKATPRPEYKVAVTFSNGECGVFDFKPYLAFPCYAPLLEQKTFAKVIAAHGTLMWPGEIDIAPETVWAETIRT